MPFNSRTDIRRVDQGPMEIFDETLRKREQVPLPSNIPDEGTLQNVDTETVLAMANFKADTGSALISKRFNTPNNTRCHEKRTPACAYAREVDERQVRLTVVVFPLTTVVLWYNAHRKARSYVKAVKAVSTEARTERN
ncbi:hypothetical protein ALC53_05285 [Atta colombica]|uniref:Uncharacterized protein n=1 Tax=Atta colombica TaxID=520822 RepID=A0A195BJF5_9HYME|nr:hypothetical protein ALC53_05285 [Atta colombica]